MEKIVKFKKENGKSINKKVYCTGLYEKDFSNAIIEMAEALSMELSCRIIEASYSTSHTKIVDGVPKTYPAFATLTFD
ncbi:MAG: hypothetical protein ABIJ28_00060 [Patescibacteria group bacterium]